VATKVTKTIKTTGGDYASLSALAIDVQDLVTADEYWEVTCDNFEDTTQATFAGWTTNSTCYLHIKMADAHDSGGVVTTNAYRLTRNATNAPLVINGTGMGSGGLIIFEGLQLYNASTSATAYAFFTATLTNACTIRLINCILESAGGYGAYINHASASVDMINCIAQGSTRAIWMNVGATVDIYHCTLHGIGYGLALNHASAVANIKNSYCYGGSGSLQAFAGTINQTKVATNDTASDDASLDNIPYTTATFVNVTGGSEDLRLVVGSGLLQVGADLSGESEPFNVPLDLEGDGRNTSSPDIGADEKDAVSSGTKAMFVIGW
jgi:hypothetical protein